jgi:hypothetical protein
MQNRAGNGKMKSWMQGLQSHVTIRSACDFLKATLRVLALETGLLVINQQSLSGFLGNTLREAAGQQPCGRPVLVHCIYVLLYSSKNELPPRVP